jgi:hypothetical protein
MAHINPASHYKQAMKNTTYGEAESQKVEAKL